MLREQCRNFFSFTIIECFINDINILNNTKTDVGEGAVKVNPKKVIDVDPEE